MTRGIRHRGHRQRRRARIERGSCGAPEHAPTKRSKPPSKRERMELERREAAFRCYAPPLKVRGRNIILVDDGLATGSTMRAAVVALRQQQPRWITVAVAGRGPIAARNCGPKWMRSFAHKRPNPSLRSDYRYDDFAQTTDEEVRVLLEEAHIAPLSSRRLRCISLLLHRIPPDPITPREVRRQFRWAPVAFCEDHAPAEAPCQARDKGKQSRPMNRRTFLQTATVGHDFAGQPCH